MKFLANTSWSEAATAAVTCIGAAVTWFTFWNGRSEKLRAARLAHRRGADELLVEVERSRQFASTEYNAKSHDKDWYDPAWYPPEFPPGHVEALNTLINRGEFPHDLESRIGRLKDVAAELRRAQAELKKVSRPASRDWYIPLVEGAKSLGQLAREQFDAIAAAQPANGRYTEKDWLQATNLYERNREFFVRHIGGPGDGALYDAWREAWHDAGFLAGSRIGPGRVQKLRGLVDRVPTWLGGSSGTDWPRW